MNENELEKILPNALLLAAAKRYDKIPDTEPIITRKYQRKFDNMLTDPFSYAKKLCRTMGQQIRHYALVAALILAILTGTIFAIPQTRSIAVDLIRQWFEDGSITFSYSEHISKFTLPEIEIEYIPNGYELFYEDREIGKYQLLIYKNEIDQYLSIDIVTDENHFSENINTEHSKMSHVKLKNGIEAQLFEGESKEWASNLLWTSNEGKVFYLINANLSSSELIKIANSIIQK